MLVDGIDVFVVSFFVYFLMSRHSEIEASQANLCDHVRETGYVVGVSFSHYSSLATLISPLWLCVGTNHSYA
jgi:hypothetical protein